MSDYALQMQEVLDKTLDKITSLEEKARNGIEEIDHALLIIEKMKAYDQGFKDARKLYCKHPPEAVQDMGDAEHLVAVCSLCEEYLEDES